MLSFCVKDSIFCWLRIWSRYHSILRIMLCPMFALDGVGHLLVESTRNRKSYWSWLNWKTKHLDGLFSNQLTPCRVPVIWFSESGKFLHVASGNLGFGIWNTARQESRIKLTIGIWDPQTTSYNPVSKTTWISLLEAKSFDLWSVRSEQQRHAWEKKKKKKKISLRP